MDVLQKQKQKLERKILVRNHFLNKYKECPVCEEKRKIKIKQLMQELKKDFETRNYDEVQNSNTIINKR